MPVRIRVVNCQSIRDAYIVVDGFTVITGPNNSGKTAFMRAVRAAFINGNVGALVRNGADDLVVAMDFGNGHSLGFKKGKTKPTYKINGSGPLYPGSKVPDELAELGVVPILTSGSSKDNKLWPQIATQFPGGQFSGPVFLLDKSGSIFAEVVADVERVGKLSKALKLCEKDHRAQLGLLKTRKKDKASIITELDTFLGLDGVIQSISALEALFAESVQTQSKVGAYLLLEDRYAKAKGEVDALEGISEVPVPPAELFTEAEQTAQEAVALKKLEFMWAVASAAVEALDGIGGVEVPPESLCVEASTLAKALSELDGLSVKMAAAIQDVANLSGISKVAVPDHTEFTLAATVGKELGELVELSNRLEAASQEVTNWKAANDAAQKVSVDDKLFGQAGKVLQGITVLSELENKLQLAQAAVSQVTSELEGANKAASEAHLAFTDLLSELDVCPTCETPMTQTHLHEEVA